MLCVILLLLAQVDPATKPLPTGQVTTRTKAILARLDEPVALNLPELTFLESILESAQRATKKGPNDPGIPIYIDPIGLRRAECTLYSTVMIPTTRAVSLKDTFARAFRPLRLAYIVKDDVLIISDPRGIERERNEVGVRACDASPATRALLARLEQPVTMSFPAETPLDEMLDYLEQVTAKTSRGSGDRVPRGPEGARGGTEDTRLDDPDGSRGCAAQDDPPADARPARAGLRRQGRAAGHPLGERHREAEAERQRRSRRPGRCQSSLSDTVSLTAIIGPMSIRMLVFASIGVWYLAGFSW